MCGPAMKSSVGVAASMVAESSRSGGVVAIASYTISMSPTYVCTHMGGHAHVRIYYKHM